MANEITFKYGDYTFPRCVSKYTLTKTGKTIRFTQPFRITGADEAALATAVAAAETACAKVYQALLVKVGASTLNDIKDANNTALLGNASLSKDGGQYDTAYARHYIFTFEAQLPASAMHGTSDGFREFQVMMAAEDTGRLTATFSGQYTAESSNSAKALFDHATTGAVKKCGDWLDTNYAQTGVRGWECIGASPQYDDQLKLASFTLVFKQRLLPEPSGGSLTSDTAGNATVFIRSCTVGRSKSPGPHGYSTSPGDRGGGAYRATVTFDVGVAVSLKTYDQLAAFYDSDIRPALKLYYDATLATALPRYTGVGGNAIQVEEAPRLDLTANGVQVTWVIDVLSEYVSYSEKITRSVKRNIRIRHLADGQPDQLILQSPGSVRFATQEVEASKVGSEAEIPYLQPAWTEGSAGWYLLDEDEPIERRFFDGVGGGAVIVVQKFVLRSYVWLGATQAFVVTPG